MELNVTLATLLPLNVGSETDRIWLLAVAIVVLVFGTFGNGLTLVALPYVRWKYPTSEFTVLRNSTADLIINLALCDFIYCSVGIGHFVHVLSIGGYPHKDGFLGGHTMCFWQAVVRHVAYIAGLFTMGAIALSIYLRQLRREIQRQVGYRRRGWVYLGILGIWIVSFLSTLGDILGVMGEYRWSGTVHGCDAVYDETKNWILPAIVILNFVIIGVCYSLMYCKLRNWAKVAKQNESLSDLRMTRAHMKIPVALSVTYSVCILPTMVAVWDENITTAIFWCMFGIDFILYIVVDRCMRAVYWRFLLDLCPCLDSKITMTISPDTSQEQQHLAGIGIKNQGSLTTLDTL